METDVVDGVPEAVEDAMSASKTAKKRRTEESPSSPSGSEGAQQSRPPSPISRPNLDDVAGTDSESGSDGPKESSDSKSESSSSSSSSDAEEAFGPKKKKQPAARRAPRKAPQGLFKGLLFCTTGQLSKPSPDLEDLRLAVTSNAGKLQTKVTKKVTHLIVARKEGSIADSDGRVKTARRLGIPVVYDDFVSDAVRARALPSISDYFSEINVSNLPVLPLL
jgi:NAD-dependent DNA ligase